MLRAMILFFRPTLGRRDSTAHDVMINERGPLLTPPHHLSNDTYSQSSRENFGSSRVRSLPEPQTPNPVAISTLCSLPLELRFEIYSYILNTANLPFDRSGETSKNDLATSLFLVNKQISQETLHYFYAVHAFSIIELPLFKPFSIANFKRILPSSLFLEPGKSPSCEDQRFILSAKVRYMGHIPVDCAPSTWIVPAHELGLIMRVFKRQQRMKTLSMIYTEVDIQTHFDSPLFLAKHKVANKIISALKLLQNPVSQSTKGHLTINLRGDLDQELKDRLASSSSPLYFEEELLRYCRERLTSANVLFDHGAYGDALCGYRTVVMLTTHGNIEARGYINSFVSMHVESCIRRSQYYSVVGEPLLAAACIKDSMRRHKDLAMYRSAFGPERWEYFYWVGIFPHDPFGPPISMAMEALRSWMPTKGSCKKKRKASIRDLEKLENEKDHAKEVFVEHYPELAGSAI